MKSTVLARKWRPKKFADVVGQIQTITILKNIIKDSRIHHAYLLTGTRGVGKTTIARIIAKALNCNNLNNSEPCCVCSICKQIDDGKFIDVTEIDAASNTGVDNIRELIDNARYVPNDGKYTTYIIDEVHMLSKSAFNALLKILEEPPAHVVFILATTELQKIPITILSRCLQLKLNHLLSDEISKQLCQILTIENITFEEEAVKVIANSALGSMRDGLSITDQAIAYCDKYITVSKINEMLGFTDKNIIFEILHHIIEKDGNNLVKIAHQIYQSGSDLEQVLIQLRDVLFDITLMHTINIESSKEIKILTNIVSPNNAQLYFEICNLGSKQIKSNDDKFPIFLMTLIRMMSFRIGNATQKQQILQTQIVTPNNEKKFNGNWHELILTLKPNLKYLYPFFENSELIKFSEHEFMIAFHERYQSTFSTNILKEIENIFSEYFQTNINVVISFTHQIHDSLKDKNQLEKQQQQAIAIQSINNDQKLSNIINTFSATILPETIKPI